MHLRFDSNWLLLSEVSAVVELESGVFDLKKAVEGSVMELVFDFAFFVENNNSLGESVHGSFYLLFFLRRDLLLQEQIDFGSEFEVHGELQVESPEEVSESTAEYLVRLRRSFQID